jgi:hypothetical protein
VKKKCLLLRLSKNKMIMVNFKSLRKFLVVLLLLSPVGFAFGQPGDPPQPDPDVPISGIELLVGAGALWGAFKALDKKKKQNI